ncbi:Uncharacterised protein [Streptococcus pyogenes]|nr:Uncharacterised protein [Streptococcus pyogenes]VGV59620.1 Uncharacterised protein [Streptococcus pyogenes]VGV65348.1 Uncharacterised protein [Streptococcus pyogenes]VGV67056.1 Uncharacterised protein [Streptococcus pyogenes]VGV76404.1 Uncharacterised protein [Streptococcus pyogenes]
MTKYYVSAKIANLVQSQSKKIQLWDLTSNPCLKSVLLQELS